MTTPTTSAASCDEQATPLPHSAGRSLGAIARANPLKLAGTFSLVALENILLVVYPLFAGFAIDAIVKGQWLQASSYALIVLLFWLIGALRRAVDTRTFTHIYAALAVPVILTQRQQQERQSTIVARVTLAREFVDFFEKHIPILATSLISIVGAAVMLMVIEFWVGIACMGVLLLFGLLLPGFSRKNQLLHERLNDRLEHEVKLVTHAQSARSLPPLSRTGLAPHPDFGSGGARLSGSRYQRLPAVPAGHHHADSPAPGLGRPCLCCDDLPLELCHQPG